MEAPGGSADAFTYLAQPVRDALSTRGFSTPTKPQRHAIPPLADGADALVIAPTGTGKTESAMLPVLSHIVTREAKAGFSALLVTPLRSLNRDMLNRLEWWGEQLDLDVDVRHGDTTQYQRQKQSEDPPDLLITTPETIQAMLTGSKLRHALTDLEHVVVDEIHELAGSKRGAQLTIALERLEELAGEYQRIGLSATVGSPEEVGRFLTGGSGCEIIEAHGQSQLDIKVHYPEVTPEDEELAQELMADPDIASHLRAIDSIIENNESTLVFVNTRQTAEGLGSRFKSMGTNIGVHHGSLSKEARIDVEDRFKAGELAALLCTSSMELGIDVGRIDHVVQYQSPRQVRRLLQRVGRAGHRRDQVSRGTIITSNPDDTLEALVLARKAAYGEVETADIHHGSLDTVANQIVGMAMGYGDVRAMRAYNVISGAYPFQEMHESEFKDVVTELSENYIIYLDEETDTISKSNGSWQYFYSNLSMIPDEVKYSVEDLASGRQVGTLDERFVLDFAEPGELFVQRGEMWRISEVDEEENTVKVSPVEDPTAQVPSWTGAEIPVPFDVAQEVGETRDEVGTLLAEGGGDVAVDALKDEYPADDLTVDKALTQVKEQDDAPIPTADRVVVESFGRELVLNMCFGHKVNETLARLVSSLLGQRLGSSIGYEVDPYRVKLEVPSTVSGSQVMDVLRNTEPEHVEAILELSLKETDSLKFTLGHVATKFGRIKKWRGAGGRSFGRGKLLEELRDTPAYEEAMREVLHEELAVPETADLLARIHAGEIRLVAVGDQTPIGAGGRSSGMEILSVKDADASLINTVKERLLSDDVLLCCIHCTEWTRQRKVDRVREQPRCPQCESTLIAALHPAAEEVISAVQAVDRTEEQEADMERAYRNAHLVQSHGKKAVIALRARGVGPQNAARIINRWRESEAEFYRDILEREREYARTKAFWD